MKKYRILIVAFFLLLFISLGITSMLKKSPTPDEISHHIPSGYVFLTKGDLRFDTSHPPLSRYIIAAPLLFLNLSLPDDKSFWRREDRGEFGREFFYAQKSPEKIIFLSRLMVLIFSGFGGIMLYLWVSRLYSKNIGALSAVLYYLSPNILAHARLATTDMVFVVFMIFSAFMFWEFLKKRTVLQSFFAGIALSLVLLCKYTAIFLLPIYLSFMIAVFIRAEQKKDFLKKILLLTAVTFLMIWAGYGFEIKPLFSDAMRYNEKVVIVSDIASRYPILGNKTGNVFRYLTEKMPIPASSYILGIFGILKHASSGHESFLLGNWCAKGNKLFFIIAYLIKTPIPVIMMFIAGTCIAIKRKFHMREYFIMTPVVIYFLLGSFSNLQLGLRYILQIYPFMFIYAAIAIASLLKNKKAVLKILGMLMLVWFFLANIYIYPNYLAYFNEFVGGPSWGYKYLRDSNLDWGQDLPALRQFMQKNNVDSVKLHYFGSADPHFYGIKYEELSEKELTKPEKNIYAISTMSADTAITWTNDYKPYKQLGYSIFIYDFRENE